MAPSPAAMPMPTASIFAAQPASCCSLRKQMCAEMELLFVAVVAQF